MYQTLPLLKRNKCGCAYNPKMKAVFIFALCPLCLANSAKLQMHMKLSPSPEDNFTETLAHLERRDPVLDSVELVLTGLLLTFALGIGFRLGMQPTPKRISPLSTPSTAAQSPARKYECEAFLFEELDLAPKVLFPEDFEPRATFETGRLASSFSDIQQLWARSNERLLRARHVLEGKDYLLREVALRLDNLQELGKAEQFQALRRRILTESPLFLSYITSWVEESEGDVVKIYAQIELFSGCSLLDLEASGRSLTQAEVAYVGKQVMKAAAFAERRQLAGFDFHPAHIYVDEQLHVKVGDFGVCATKHWNETLSALLVRLTQAEPVLQRQHSSPTVNTF